jgi:dephospho-CoA kinase
VIYCVGLTGNIASGKTTVAEIFSELGIDVFNADKIARELSAKNTPAYNKIVHHFGTVIVQENKELNRSALREIIFNNPDERQWLEQLLHPLIRQQLELQIKSCTTPYCVVEIPLLIDKKHYPYLKKILLISAPLDIQIGRVMKRDQCTKEQALAILSAQPDMNLRILNADDVIVNDSGFEPLKRAITDMHFKYLHEARNAVQSAE